MLRCKEIVELVASDALHAAPLTRRLAVLMHLAMCRHCRAYVRQLRGIGRAVRRLYDAAAVDPNAAQRIANAVREAAQGARPEDPLPDQGW